MDRVVLLQKLPPFTNRSVVIRNNQTVNDIVKEVVAAHHAFAPDYDAIAWEFDRGSNIETAKALFRFLKSNVRYNIESEARQTTKSPAAILTQAEGDCKHYSGFAAGVLDALKRSGKQIDWCYRFASYNAFDQLPGHVFVVLNEGGNEYWIDPVLKTFNERLEPVYILDKKVKINYMLERISGIDSEAVVTGYDDNDSELSPELEQAILLLFNHGILDSEGRVNDAVLTELANTLPNEEFEQIAQARILLQSAAIGGFFEDIFRGVKKVWMVGPRNAYLSLVGINAFGYATKLYNCLFNKDGSYNQSGKDKLYKIWHDRFAGDWSKFENTVKTGARKKAVLGAAQVAVPAWVAAATAVIAAMAPVISAILKQQASAGMLDSSIDPLTGLPYGMNNYAPQTSGGIMDFVQRNPLIVVGVAAGAVYFLTKNKTA